MKETHFQCAEPQRLVSVRFLPAEDLPRGPVTNPRKLHFDLRLAATSEAMQSELLLQASSIELDHGNKAAGLYPRFSPSFPRFALVEGVSPLSV